MSNKKPEPEQQDLTSPEGTAPVTDAVADSEAAPAKPRRKRATPTKTAADAAVANESLAADAALAADADTEALPDTAAAALAEQPTVPQPTEPLPAEAQPTEAMLQVPPVPHLGEYFDATAVPTRAERRAQAKAAKAAKAAERAAARAAEIAKAAQAKQAAQAAQPASEAPAPRRRALGIAATVAVSALVGGAAGAGGTALILANQPTAAGTAGGQPAITITATDSVSRVSAIAAKAAPSVVTLNVNGRSQAGSGSGVVLSADGYIVTNNHVVTIDGQREAPTVTVTTTDGTIYPAEIIGTDPVVDLAVVKIEPKAALQPIEFGNSSLLNVGAETVAIGSPLGLDNTVTNGIVSAVNRSIQVASPTPAAQGNADSQAAPRDDSDDNSDGPLFDFWRDFTQQRSTTRPSSTISLPVVQTDAAINPGNSGGALLNDQGQLIGINVAIATAGGSRDEAGSIGVGFAIPSNLVKRVTSELIADGKASHALLGATVTDAGAVEGATVLGAAIVEVVDGSAAAQAGLQKDDIVTSLGGIPIRSSQDLTAQVRYLPGGTTTELVYHRGGQAVTVTVNLGTLS